MIRSTPRECEPSASKIPARNPACHARGPQRQAPRSAASIWLATSSRRAVWIAVIVASRRASPAANGRVLVAIPSSARICVAFDRAPRCRRARVGSDGCSRVRSVVGVGAVEDHAVAADHAREVTATVRRIDRHVDAMPSAPPSRNPAAGCSSSGTDAAAGPLIAPVTCFQPRFGQEPVVTARDELRPVRQGHAVRAFARRPLRAHPRLRRSAGTRPAARFR